MSRPAVLGRHPRAWIAAAGALLAAVAAALAPAPSVLSDGDAVGRSTFAALTTTAIVALSVVPLMVRRGTRAPVWVAVAIAALALGVGSFSVTGYAQRACTARYAGKAILIGTELTPLGANYKRANPELSSDEMLFDAAGVPERIWTRGSIGRCRAFVGSTYFLWIPLLVVCLLAVANAFPRTVLPPGLRGAPAPVQATDVPLLYDVFVSYRHDEPDRSVARDLVAALETDGYRVAIDERDFPANASFLQEMERCIRQSRFTVAIISARYLESGNTQEEAIISKVLDMNDRRRRLIPLLIESVAMPAWLFGIVGIDCTRRDPLVDPFDKLKATIGAPLVR